MTVTMRPGEIRRGWTHADDAAAAVGTARCCVDGAGGAGAASMGDLTSVLDDAARDLDGVLAVVLGVLGEHHDQVEDCIRDFTLSDGASAGAFRGLTP